MQEREGRPARPSPRPRAPGRSGGGERHEGERHEVAEYALLGLLRSGPAHGYRLAAAFAPDGLLGPILRLKMSQMYAYLHKMERQGWLRARVELVEVARARRVFALTPVGELAFDRWIAQPVSATREVRLDFMVKLAFAIRQDRTQAAALVSAQRAALADWLARLRAQEAAHGDEPPTSMRRLVLGHRVCQSEATLTWLDDLTRRL
jgi:DNA-binding PadR family transcriptional regulator